MTTLEFTEQELGFIRSALCRDALRMCARAFESKREAEKLGSTDMSTYKMFMSQRSQVHKILDKIDERQVNAE